MFVKQAAALVAITLLSTGCGSGGESGTSSGGGDGTVSRAGCTLSYANAEATALRAGADPLLARQWHLQPIAAQLASTDAIPAWATTGVRGEGARVAVVDDAVELVHEDLWPNARAVLAQSHDYLGSRLPLPCIESDDHGTAVAGIVAARDDNTAGGAGVAPRAELVGYNALATSTDADIADAMTRGLAANGVVHNSWGSPDEGSVNAAPSLWERSIEQGLRSGRGGLGTVYVFSAGNGGATFVPQQGGGAATISENSNLDGYVNKLGINAICAVGADGRAPRYSEPGANLLVCGPSSGAGSDGITTTALRNGYRNDFSGTSASAPMASGVAALVLARRPDLSWRDVRLILAQSSRETDAANPSWLPSALPGKRFSHRYGYGVVDASAAMRLAAGWSSVGGSASLTPCGPFEGRANLPIPPATGSFENVRDGAPALDTVNVAAAACGITSIEFVEVAFATDHPYPADLQIRLYSPAGGGAGNGFYSELAQPRSCGSSATGSRGDPCRTAYRQADGTPWRFGSVRHLGEPAAGAWRLEVIDRQPEDEGRILSWSLRLWGR